MKNIIIVALLLSVVTGAVAYRTMSTNDQPHQLGAASVQLLKDEKVYDVRTVEEFAVSHVKTATLIPITDMQAGKFPDVPKDTPIALYCRSGNRAGIALDLMKKAGFTNVRNLGGLTDLSKYGLKAE